MTQAYILGGNSIKKAKKYYIFNCIICKQCKLTNSSGMCDECTNIEIKKVLKKLVENTSKKHT